MSTAIAADPGPRNGLDVRRALQHRETSILILLALVLAAVGLVNPNFVRVDNIRDILVNSVPTIVVACGMTLVVLMGEIDISVGSTLALCAATMGAMTADNHPIATAAVVAVVVLIGAGIGLLNGVMVAYGRMPSIIVTLGMLTLLSGLKLIVLSGRQFDNLPDAIRWVGTASFLYVPISVWAAFAIVGIFAAAARSTALGLRLYACGSNPDAARLGGLPVNGIKLLVFVLTGLLAAIAAIFQSGHLGIVGSSLGVDFELKVVTAVVVGGCAISGGRGSILGSVTAAILLGTIASALVFMKLGASATYWEQAIQGGFILAAVLADHFRRKRSTLGGAL